MKTVLVALIASTLALMSLNVDAKIYGVDEKLLAEWDETFHHTSRFEEQCFHKIDSLKHMVGESPQLQDKAFTCFDIGHEYEGLDIDSSLHYYRESCRYFREAGMDDHALVARSRRASVLPLDNKVHECIAELGRMKPELIKSNELKEKAWVNFLAANRRIAHFSNSEEENEISRTASRQCVDSLMKIIDERSPLYNYLLGLQLTAQKKLPIANASFKAAIDSTSDNDNVSVMASLALIRNKMATGDNADALERALKLSIILGRRADSQIETLLLLSKIFNDEGDTERAFKCLVSAVDHAVESGADMPALMAANNYTSIVEVFIAKLQARNRRMIVAIVVLGLLLTVGAVIVLRKWRLERRQHASDAPGQEEGALQAATPEPPVEGNYADFINLSGIYIDQLDEFRQMAKLKITTGNVNELYAQLKSPKSDALQAEAFFDGFDAAFLKVYPNFVAEVNQLLEADKQIVLATDGRLNNELRIFALMKLGVDDTARIARFIGVSVNTIYTYRNKMRSRAINRDEFEEQLVK